MTDRELLEAAARAVGYEIHAKWQAERDDAGYGAVGLWLQSGHTGWNPLTDDAAAFRLAASLGLVVDFSRPSAALPFTRHEYTLSEGGNNPEATRRAIVRAAAQIGGKQ